MKQVKVVVGNRWVRLLKPYPRKLLDRVWSYSDPSYEYIARRANVGGWDGRRRFLKDGFIPAGLWRATRKEIKEEHGIRFKVVDRARETCDLHRGIQSDRKYQNECAESIVASIPRGGGLVLNATGSGKTYIAGIVASRVGGQFIFIVDQLDLLEQGRAELERVLGEKVGYVGNGVFVPRRVTVATVQTIHRHLADKRFRKWLAEIDVIFIDEIHVQMNRRNFKSVAKIEPKAVIGLTATLELSKKHVRMRAWAITGPVLYEYPLIRGVEEGVLEKGRVVRVQYENKVEETDFKQMYVNEYTDRIVDNVERNQLVRRLAKYCVADNRFTIVLVHRVRHVKLLSRLLKEIPHRLVYGEKAVGQRIVAKKRFERGRIRLLVANQVFKKGIDIKRLDAIIDAAGMKSANDALQKFGRGVRKHQDKTELWYFDIADTDSQNKENRYQKAARRRNRAFKKAGIETKDFRWEVGETKRLYRQAREWLNGKRKQRNTSGKDSG